MSGHIVTDIVAAGALILSLRNLHDLRQAEKQLKDLERRVLALALRQRKPIRPVGERGPDITPAGTAPREGGR